MQSKAEEKAWKKYRDMKVYYKINLYSKSKTLKSKNLKKNNKII